MTTIELNNLSVITVKETPKEVSELIRAFNFNYVALTEHPSGDRVYIKKNQIAYF